MLTIVKPSLWIRLPLCAQSRLVNSLDLARPSSSKSSKKDEPKDNRSVFENLSKLTEKPFSTCLKKLYSKYPIEIDKIFWSIMEDPKYEKCSIQTRLQLTAYRMCQRHGFVQLKAGKNKLRSTEASISDHGQYLEDFEEGILISTDNTDLIDPFEPRTYKVHDSVSHVPWYQRSLKQQTSAMRLLSTSSRKFSTSSTLVKSNQRPPLKKPPSLLSQLVPNFVSSGLQIDSFRRKIDPNFDPQDFLEGTKLALFTTSQLIKAGKYHELEGLFSKHAKNELIKDIEMNWTEIEKNNIAIDANQLSSAIIDKLEVSRVAYDIFVDIDVKFRAINSNLDPSMSTRLKLTFTRKYGQGCFPDWIISDFKLVQLKPQSFLDKFW